MNREDCVQLGYISKPHGVRGDVRAVFDVYDLDEYRKRKDFWFAKKDESLVAAKISRFQPQHKNEVILHIDGVEDRDQAETWIGRTIFVPMNDLPALPEGHFYYFQVIGFQVVDQVLGSLGTVIDFADGAAQDIMIMEYEGKEVLIPITETFVGKADMEQKVVYTHLPEGLVEAYLAP